MTKILHIKNMVCNRCIKVIKDEISNLGHIITNIELGKVEFKNTLNPEDLKKLSDILEQNGFEIIDNKKSRLITKIKTTIIELVHYQEKIEGHINLSTFLTENFGYDYSYISNLFSSVEGTTIEKYLINQKVERVKEYLVYDELNLNEISFKIGYSSVQHLSNQFKKVTGLSPSHFKKLRNKKRKPLDKV